MHWIETWYDQFLSKKNNGTGRNYIQALIAYELYWEAKPFSTFSCFVVNPKDLKQNLIEIPLDLFEDILRGLLGVNTPYRQVLLLFHSI